MVIDIPDADEKRGFNPVSRSVFSTSKLEFIGWNVRNTLREGLYHTINEIKL